uniref:Ubiquitin fusion degradation protein UFD1 N-terminal subdomain 1 domain-containing protein n=1 Tax=Neolamprologus brichardi TaxID=32507 RepID=A0A3Q4HSD3_NEOBR
MKTHIFLKITVIFLFFSVIMPPSALDQLSRLNITYPMLFKLTNKNSDRMTHCGVLEFVADEGICYLPHWFKNSNLLVYS